MNDLADFWATAWDILESAPKQRDATARTISVATQGADGMPQLRSVVLRTADRTEPSVVFYTDLKSAKCAEISENPRTALLVWSPEARVQIRLSTTALLLHGAGVADIWATMPDMSKSSYGNMPYPGAPLARATDLVNAPDPARFAVAHCRVQRVDLVDLDPSLHRRAIYVEEEGWAGRWVTP